MIISHWKLPALSFLGLRCRTHAQWTHEKRGLYPFSWLALSLPPMPEPATGWYIPMEFVITVSVELAWYRRFSGSEGSDRGMWPELRQASRRTLLGPLCYARLSSPAALILMGDWVLQEWSLTQKRRNKGCWNVLTISTHKTWHDCSGNKNLFFPGWWSLFLDRMPFNGWHPALWKPPPSVIPLLFHTANRHDTSRSSVLLHIYLNQALVQGIFKSYWGMKSLGQLRYTLMSPKKVLIRSRIKLTSLWFKEKGKR